MAPRRSRSEAPDAPETTLAACLAKFDEPIQEIARACLARLRELSPGAIELVYDAYNALSIPFATGEKLGDAFAGIAIYPRHVNLTFLRGAELDDPHGLLRGTGSSIRHVRVDDVKLLRDRRIASLVRAAAKLAGFRPVRGAATTIVIKKIYARQRSRRPG